MHDVRFMQRLMFDLRVDDGWVGDPCGVRAGRAGHHVVREPAGTARGLVKGGGECATLTDTHFISFLSLSVSCTRRAEGEERRKAATTSCKMVTETEFSGV